MELGTVREMGTVAAYRRALGRNCALQSPAPLLPWFCCRPGGSKKEAVRRRLRLGINEVTKFLEATAAVAASCKHESCRKAPLGRGKRAGGGEGGGGTPFPTPRPPSAIVLVCRDVRPATLVGHVHALVALTGKIIWRYLLSPSLPPSLSLSLRMYICVVMQSLLPPKYVDP